MSYVKYGEVAQCRGELSKLGGMILKLNHNFRLGLAVRLRSAWRCLVYPHYIGAFWTKENGEVDYRVVHIGCPPAEAVRRIQDDVLDIFQNVEDGCSALDEAREILSS